MYTYLYDPNSELYYKITATVDVDTGFVTAEIDQTGLSSDPGYVPAPGDTLIPLTYYITYFNLDPATIDGNQYNTVSMAVTRYIQRYTCNDWTGISVPEDLMTIGSLMIRDKIEEAKKIADLRFKSESVLNYSYTINDNYLTKALYAKYSDELDMFRIVPFA